MGRMGANRKSFNDALWEKLCQNLMQYDTDQNTTEEDCSVLHSYQILYSHTYSRVMRIKAFP